VAIVDSDDLKQLVKSHTGPALDLRSVRLECTPEELIDAVFALPCVFVPDNFYVSSDEKHGRYLKKKIQLTVCGIKASFCATLITMGKLHKKQPIINRLDAIERTHRTEVDRRYFSLIRTAQSFVREVSAYCNHRIIVDLFQIQTDLLIDITNKQIKQQGLKSHVDAKMVEDVLKSVNQARQQLLVQETCSLTTVVSGFSQVTTTLIKQIATVEYSFKAYKKTDIEKQLTLQSGICQGTTLSYIVERLKNKNENMPKLNATMWPSALGRFLQADHYFTLFFPEDQELEKQFESNVIEFRRMLKEHTLNPSQKLFFKCNKTHFKASSIAMRRLGLYHQLPTLKIEMKTRNNACSTSGIEVEKTTLQTLEDQLVTYKKRIYDWHITSQNFDANTRLLHQRSVHLEALFLKKRCIADIPAFFTQLQGQLVKFDKHLFLGMCTISTKENEFTEQDGLSIRFYEKMVQLAKLRRISSSYRSSKKLKATILIQDAFNNLHQTMSDAERKNLSSLFTKRFADILAREIAEKRVGKDAPEPVLERISKKLKQSINRKLADFEQSHDQPIETRSGDHAIYLKLDAPFELRDPNAPNNPLISSDWNEFILYTILWMMREDFTHVTEVWHAQSRERK